MEPATTFFFIIIAIFGWIICRDVLFPKHRFKSSERSTPVVDTPSSITPFVHTPPIVSSVVVNPIEWFVGTWGVGEPSAAEHLIINELNRYPIHWEREVSFRGLQLSSMGWARFDFYLPEYKLCIEYQGAGYHSAPDRVASDELKATFCKQNNIQLIYLDRSHYFKMPYTISKIMKSIGVSAI